MTLLIVSFIAGILTVLAPCVLPLLPIIVGRSLVNPEENKSKTNYRPLVIAASLAVSVIIFTLLLKTSTALLGVPTMVWQVISGIIIIVLGLSILLPDAWKRLPGMARFNASSGQLLGKSTLKKGAGADILTGFALGPVFNSCSPTYAFLVAGVLPASFGQGLAYLTAYTVGLSGMLLIIAYAGQAAVKKLGWLSNSHGVFHKIIGLLFVLVGLSLIFGLDKKLQAFILEHGWYNPISGLEERLR